MNQHLETFIELPIAHRVGALAGGIILFVLVFWFIFLSGLGDELSELDNEINGPNGLRFQVSQQRGIADNLDRFLKEVARLEIELKKALLELPDKKEIDNLLARVSSVGRDSGLEIRLFKPKEEQKKDYYAEVPVEMEVYGTFHQVATFFDEVGHLDRIVNLDDYNLGTPEVGDDAITLKTTVIATTFRFLDESERPKDQEKGSKKGRRRRRG